MKNGPNASNVSRFFGGGGVLSDAPLAVGDGVGSLMRPAPRDAD